MSQSTTAAATGQVNTEAAEIYDAFFVPALFGTWAGPLCDAAGLKPGQRVLDVACGTGATTRVAAERVQPGGNVIGLDCNDGMLAVARRRAPDIPFRSGMAEALPFGDAEFDAVTCQFALMFFQDRAAALADMTRVLRPGGRLALSVWDTAETSPGYAAMIALIDRLFGAEAADALRAPFALGDRDDLQEVLNAGGLTGARIDAQIGEARFTSIADWVRMDVRGWTLADMIDDDQYAVLVRAAEAELAHFAGPDGTVRFAAPAHLVTWTAPA